MRLKHKETGEVVGMRHGPAVAAVRAGTHEFVNAEGTRPAWETAAPSAAAPVAVDGPAEPTLDDMTKEGLLAEAARLGIEEAKPAMKKDEILELVRGAQTVAAQGTD